MIIQGVGNIGVYFSIFLGCQEEGWEEVRGRRVIFGFGWSFGERLFILRRCRGRKERYFCRNRLNQDVKFTCEKNKLLRSYYLYVIGL